MTTVKMTQSGKDRYNAGKMSIDSIYSGFCCPVCVNPGRHMKRCNQLYIRGKSTLRNHRNNRFWIHKYKGRMVNMN